MNGWGDCVTKEGIATISCIVSLYQIAIGAAIDLVGLAALFMLLFASFKYITSGGGKQVEEAKNIVTYAILGLVVVMLAIFIINLIAGVTGVTCILTFGFGTCK